MTENEVAACAAALAEARRNGRMIDALPATPASVTEALAIQDRVTSLLGATVAAFKAGIGADIGPTRGVTYSGTVRPSPASFTSDEAPHRGAEGEVAFRFTRDLPPIGRDYTRDEVAASVVALPAIEVVSGRLKEPTARPKLEQIADCMAYAGLVTGEALADFAHLDLAALHVTMRVNGEITVDRTGGIGDPLGVAVALVNLMLASGGVKAGQVVTTGSWTGLPYLEPGDHCEVRFEGLGVVEVQF